MRTLPLHMDQSSYLRSGLLTNERLPPPPFPLVCIYALSFSCLPPWSVEFKGPHRASPLSLRLSRPKNCEKGVYLILQIVQCPLCYSNTKYSKIGMHIEKLRLGIGLMGQRRRLGKWVPVFHWAEQNQQRCKDGRSSACVGDIRHWDCRPWGGGTENARKGWIPEINAHEKEENLI